MFWFRRNQPLSIYRSEEIERRIRLFEKQMAAATAIGEKWCLHPARRSERLEQPMGEITFWNRGNGASVINKAYKASRKALRLVK
jgi:hypothetical protein